MVSVIKGEITIWSRYGADIACYDLYPEDENFDFNDYLAKSDGTWKSVLKLLNKDRYVIDNRKRRTVWNIAPEFL